MVANMPPLTPMQFVIARIAVLFALLLLPGQAAASQQTGTSCKPAEWQSLFRAHLRRYPAMGHQDAFKLLQQAAVGSEHAIGDTSAVLRWMSSEWESMGTAAPTEPLVDTLGAGGFARLHLRPFRRAGGDPEALTRAFIETGRVGRGDAAALSCAVESLVSLSHSGTTPWPVDSIRGFAARWKASGYPAVSHTPAFRSAYSPAYRVVALRFVDQLVAKLVRK